MCSKCINSTSSCKVLTISGFNNPDFLYYMNISSVKPKFKSNLSKLFKNWTINYVHAHKSFPIASQKELVFSWQTESMYQNLIKIRHEMWTLS